MLTLAFNSIHADLGAPLRHFPRLPLLHPLRHRGPSPDPLLQPRHRHPAVKEVAYLHILWFHRKTTRASGESALTVACRLWRGEVPLAGGKCWLTPTLFADPVAGSLLRRASLKPKGIPWQGVQRARGLFQPGNPLLTSFFLQPPFKRLDGNGCLASGVQKWVKKWGQIIRSQKRAERGLFGG